MKLLDKIKKIENLRGKLNLRFTSQRVEAKTRAIKCVWTREMVDDLLKYKNIK